MDILELKNLSDSSRDVLNRFRKKLAKKNLNLNQLSSQVFGFERTKFTQKQFRLLISKLVSKSTEKDIDGLFKEMD